MVVAVVTGAGRGIGAAISAALEQRGFDVVRADLRPGEGLVAVDVRSAQSLRDLAQQAGARGPVVVWVNNAGVMMPRAAAWEADDEEIATQVEVNLLGVIHGTRAALSVMSGGDIVNIASTSAYGPVPGIATYGATKAAVRSWTLSIDAELRQSGHGVRMHAVSPDAVDTRLVRDTEKQQGMELIHTTPALLQPEQVADAVLAMLGSNRVIRALPVWRGALVQLSGLAPSATRPLLGVLRRAGARRQARAGERPSTRRR